MPHPAPPVQPEAGRTIFVRQQFSQFGGAELILDRMLSALAARGKRVALLGVPGAAAAMSNSFAATRRR